MPVSRVPWFHTEHLNTQFSDCRLPTVALILLKWPVQQRWMKELLPTPVTQKYKLEHTLTTCPSDLQKDQNPICAVHYLFWFL